jgi:hypothetical protein
MFSDYCFCQDVVYFDSTWHKTSKQNAQYYRVVVPLDNKLLG